MYPGTVDEAEGENVDEAEGVIVFEAEGENIDEVVIVIGTTLCLLCAPVSFNLKTI